MANELPKPPQMIREQRREKQLWKEVGKPKRIIPNRNVSGECFARIQRQTNPFD